MSRKYSFVALDLDGTTLNDDHEFSSSTVEILRKLDSLGVTICFATGRSTKNVEQYILQLDLDQNIPVVCFNGSYGFQRLGSTMSPIFEDPLPAAVTSRIISFGQECGCVCQYYNGRTGDVYAVPKSDEHIMLLQRYARLVGKNQIILDSYDEAFTDGLSAKVLIMTNNADEIIQSANDCLPQSDVTIIKGSPNPFFVEFLRADVNKGAGLRKLCNYLGVPLEEVVAFGDGDNDKEMLSYAGLGCAVKNAKEIAKNAATINLEWTNNENGVARQLCKMLEDGDFRI